MDSKLIKNELEKYIFDETMYEVEEYTLENLVPDVMNKVVTDETGRIRWTYTSAPNDMHLFEFRKE